MHTSPRSPAGSGVPPPRGWMLISVSNTGTPTVPGFRVPDRNAGLPVACMVTSVSPYPSPMVAPGRAAPQHPRHKAGRRPADAADLVPHRVGEVARRVELVVDDDGRAAHD